MDPSLTADLPDLPDFADLITTAEARLAHFTAVRDAAQLEVDRAQDYLDRLRGDATSRRRPRMPHGRYVSGDLQTRVLERIAAHPSGVYATTLSSEVGKAMSTTNAALSRLVAAGHVRMETRQRGRRRYWISDAGVDVLTAPKEPVAASANGNGH